MHINLHKDFSSPRRRLGPGGARRCSDAVAPFATLPLIACTSERFRFIEDDERRARHGALSPRPHVAHSMARWAVRARAQLYALARRRRLESRWPRTRFPIGELSPQPHQGCSQARLPGPDPEALFRRRVFDYPSAYFSSGSSLYTHTFPFLIHCLFRARDLN